MRRYTALLAAVLLLGMVIPALSIAAQPSTPGIWIYLRRNSFDPLTTLPPVATVLRAVPTSNLLLVQFVTVPGLGERATFAEAGLLPLAYIPDNTLLVRRLPGAHMSVLVQAGVRWNGPFQLADKLAPDLDGQIDAPDVQPLRLHVLLARDADVALFAHTLAALGGLIRSQADGMNGVMLSIELPASELLALLRQDSVLWVERAQLPRVANDRAQAVTGVVAARQRFGWLDGSGQIVAVTDTGLDVQAQVQADGNPDFAASQIVAASTPAQMNPTNGACQAVTDWNDRYGHGTHVAGSVLGVGTHSPAGVSYAGVAPAARLVVQSVSLGGTDLECLPAGTTFLAQAYAAGARVQNASWGSPTGGTNTLPQFGGYDAQASQVDEFLWQHKDYVFVAAAGNEGIDVNPPDGVIDADSIDSPGTAKNVLTVGATENDRPPTGACSSFVPVNLCWSSLSFYHEPLADDYVSNHADGMAAFSSRGPTDDGRLKPELVAPGTNIISAASHASTAVYRLGRIGSDYAYDAGTSMATPLVSGMAALVRQWLEHQRGVATPSAALVKALLLNGATNIAPGQYGEGAFQEIPTAWPNTVAGWGRAALADSLGDATGQGVWFADNRIGLVANGTSITYTLFVGTGQPFRLTLAWTDYPASPTSGRALVNDLDLMVITPTNAVLHGNEQAQLGATCRDAIKADRCNTVESVAIAAPVAGVYRVVVRGAQLPFPAQPYGLVARASSVGTTPAQPVLTLSGPKGPVVHLQWNAVPAATTYEVEEGATPSFTPLTHIAYTSTSAFDLVTLPGTYWYRVRACYASVCGPFSAIQTVVVAQAPQQRWLPQMTSK